MSSSSSSDPRRELLRHTLATVAYRGAKAILHAPEGFDNFQAAGRVPGRILAHMGDLMEWSLSMASGTASWNESQVQPWDKEAERFFQALQRFDAYLASEQPLACPMERLFQGPIADALTHVGQLAMLRRMAGASTVGENYFAAAVEVGRVGPDQAAPEQPFRA
jgi:hypothetical protein